MKINRIRYLSRLDENNPDNDNMDVLVELDDGRSCLVVFSTPNNIYWCMENEGKDYFFGVPIVFVKRLTAENLKRAIEAIILEDEGKWFEDYGSRQARCAGE